MILGGGVQNIWGQGNVPENAPSRKLLVTSIRVSGLLSRGLLCKPKAMTPEGPGKRAKARGSKDLFREGCPSWGFPPPPFFHPPPPMASSDAYWTGWDTPPHRSRSKDNPSLSDELIPLVPSRVWFAQDTVQPKMLFSSPTCLCSVARIFRHISSLEEHASIKPLFCIKYPAQ